MSKLNSEKMIILVFLVFIALSKVRYFRKFLGRCVYSSRITFAEALSIPFMVTPTGAPM